MDFFAQQQLRKQKTFFYAFLFVLSLIIIDVFLCLVLQVPLKAFFQHTVNSSKWPFYILISLAFFFSVLVSFFKMLYGPGLDAGKFSMYLGASPLNQMKQNRGEKIFRHCVEEMSIASGVPCPSMYILEHETGINAMACGYSIHDSAIVVTQGALQQLNRDELQAVVAHEFGHILSGDIRINMFLLAALNSISSIYLLGKFFIYPKKGRIKFKGGLYQIGLGIMLMLIGGVGQFFSKLMKVNLSRQREFLADALAVQFTRNADALVSVLKKIGGDRWGGQIFNQKLEKASHMMFVQLNQSGGSSSWFSSHPSLISRIKVYEKNFKGQFPKSRKKEAMPGVESSYSQVKTAAELGGMFSPLDLVYAEHFLKKLDMQQYHWLKKGKNLKTTIYALYLDMSEKNSVLQKSYLKKNMTVLEYEQCLKAYDFFKTHSYNEKIGIQDLLLPKIKKQRIEFLQEMNAMINTLIKLDHKISLFEAVAYKIFQKNCIPSAIIKSNTMKERQALEVLLSSLAYAGELMPDQLSSAMLAGARFFYKHDQSIHLLGKEHFKHELLFEALQCVAKFSFYKRQRLLSACYRTVMYDRQVSDKQASILRLLGEYLEFPVPISSHVELLKQINHDKTDAKND